MWTRWLRSSVRRGMWQSDVLDADRRCLKNGAVREYKNAIRGEKKSCVEL